MNKRSFNDNLESPIEAFSSQDEYESMNEAESSDNRSVSPAR